MFKTVTASNWHVLELWSLRNQKINYVAGVLTIALPIKLEHLVDTTCICLKKPFFCAVISYHLGLNAALGSLLPNQPTLENNLNVPSRFRG